MKLLLDTNFIIGLLRTDENYISKFEEIKSNDLYISPLTVTEIYAGCRANEIGETENLLQKIFTIPLSKLVSREAGLMIYHYSKRGKKIYIADAIIGATAKIHHLTLITQNIKDFPMLYPSQIERFPK